MILAPIIILTILVVINLIGYVISGPKYTGPITDHFDGKKFINPGNIKPNGLRAVLKWMTNRQRGSWSEMSESKTYEKPVPRVHEGLKITFVNHSTFLIQTAGLNILTDPVWSYRVSPFTFAGPKRMQPPGVKFEDLPAIDVVLLTHNHYDHLDVATLKRIFAIHQPKIISPLGVKEFLKRKSIVGTIDLDWWDDFKLNETVSVVATPAQHFSGRGTFDRDATLWCGYMLKRNEGNVYFAGDTGYNAITFKEIGERFSPIQVAFIPIGAYKPQWFMSPIHCSPSEAVQIHKDVNSQQSIAMHFGTFPLADEGEADPKNDLATALKNNGIPQENFIALQHGEGRMF